MERNERINREVQNSQFVESFDVSPYFQPEISDRLTPEINLEHVKSVDGFMQDMNNFNNTVIQPMDNIPRYDDFQGYNGDVEINIENAINAESGNRGNYKSSDKKKKKKREKKLRKVAINENEAVNLKNQQEAEYYTALKKTKQNEMLGGVVESVSECCCIVCVLGKLQKTK